MFRTAGKGDDPVVVYYCCCIIIGITVAAKILSHGARPTALAAVQTQNKKSLCPKEVPIEDKRQQMDTGRPIGEGNETILPMFRLDWR